MVVALPALHLIVRAYPNAERRLLTNFPVASKAPAATAIFAETGLVHGYFRYSVGTRNLRSVISLWLQLLRWRPGVMVYLADARGIRTARRDSVFFRLCGIKNQIAMPLTDSQQQCELHDGVLEPEASRLVRNLSPLGTIDLNDPACWDLHLTDAEMAKATAVLAEAGTRPILAVSIGTKMQSKDWGRENWQALLTRLAELYPEYVLALAGASEEAADSHLASKGWHEAAGDSASVINLCGKLSPRESAAVFAKARLFIGHDSGPMHLAAAVQTPCVAIFSARNKPRQWFPFGSRHHVIYRQVACSGCALETCIAEKKRCLTGISVVEVLAVITDVLNTQEERLSVLKEHQ